MYNHRLSMALEAFVDETTSMERSCIAGPRMGMLVRMA